MAHEEGCHNNPRVERVAQDEVEVEGRLVMAGAAHGLHVEGEDAVLDSSHLIVLHKQDSSFAVGIRHEVTFVLEVLQASGALLDGVEVVVQHYALQDEGFLTYIMVRYCRRKGRGI